MEKFSKGLFVALLGCAAISVSACKDKGKPEEKPTAAAPSPAPTASTSEPAKQAQPKESKSAAPVAEPAKVAEAKVEEAKPAAASTAATPGSATPAKAAEDAKSSSATASKPADQAAPSSDQPKGAEARPAAAPAAATAEAPASAKPSEEAKPAAAAETKTAEAAAAAPSSDAKPVAAAPAAAPSSGAAQPADAAAAGEDPKDRTSPPDPVSELAKQQGFKFEDGRYRNKDGNPQPVVTRDFMVDWGTWNGFRRYHDACHVCHGPNALGSTFAPALKDSLKTLDYDTFVATVSSGKQENRGGTMFVMPAFGTDKNIMCYLDDIYTYIKARSLNDTSEGKDGMPAGRPNNREDISDEARKAADDCTGG